MNFDLTEDQTMLKAVVERFVSDSYGGDLEARRAARALPAGFSAKHWSRLAETGVLAMAVSADNGGLGNGRIELMVAMEALGRGLVAEPVIDVAVVAAGMLDAAGCGDVLAPLMAGTMVAVLAHSEREARYNLRHVATKATVGGERVLIDGCKTNVLSGGPADMLIVSARSHGGNHEPEGMGFWLIAANATGVDRRPYRLADGSVAAEIGFRGVEVAADARLGGLELLLPVVAKARLAAAAEMLGLMNLLFDATLAYVKTRVQFGKSLGSFQVIQHRMTDAYVMLEQARSQVLRAALADDADFAAAAAGAKAYVGEAALAVAHTAVQMHGGMGITDELLIGHALKRLRVLTLTFGDGAVALDEYRRAA